MLHAARGSDVELPLLSAIPSSNHHQIQRGIEAILRTHKKRIGVVGLAFKSGTDDLRESPMVTVVETLIGKGCAVRIYDPNVSVSALVGANRQYIEREIPHIASLMSEDIDAVIEHAEVVVIGSPGVDATRAQALVRPNQIVVDLTRATGRSVIANETAEESQPMLVAIQQAAS
jgi:GDP-mannose 6-dehydrogenase